MINHRQAAIDAIAKMMPQSLTPDGSHPADKEIFIAQEAFADCIKTIEILPSAQQERKKGKWIDETFKPWGLVYHPYKCDQCGEHSEADSNYCSNCGAKME